MTDDMTVPLPKEVKLDINGQIWKISTDNFPVKLAFGEKQYILRVTKSGKLILN